MGPTTISHEETIEHHISQLLELLEPGPDCSDLSPQLRKRLLHLTEIKLHPIDDHHEFVRRFASVFSRLILELVQAHYNTKQREQDLIRLIHSKGCSISDPELTDTVIDLLVKLYTAAGHNTDTSYERNVLIRFLLKEIGERNCAKRQVEKIVQTLYKSSCFHVTKLDGAPGRLRLREDLCLASNLRQKHDVELIKFAQTNCIRLPPESWVHLLYGYSSPVNLAKMQSLIDKHLPPVSVYELQMSVIKMGDKYGISKFIDTLEHIQNLIKDLSSETGAIDTRVLCDVMKKLVDIKHLFNIRQCRGRLKS